MSNRCDDDDDTVLGEVLAVAQDNVADVTDTGAVDQRVARGNGSVEPGALAVDLQYLADF